ncbi:MAG TPA: ATP-binding protein [Chloroflexia bacterium]|nr:ATP-binding protein [Chloroflexia bacterium]
MPKLTLLGQFSIISLVLMLVIGAVLGWDLRQYFEQQAIAQQRDAVRDLVPPVIGDLISDELLENGAQGETYAAIERQLANLGGSGLVRVKIWNRDGEIIYSDQMDLIGWRGPLSSEIREALDGLTVATISPLDKEENVEERGFGELLEVYTPLRQAGETEIVGVFEGYYDITDLRDRIDDTNEFLWVAIVFGFAFLYISLFTIVRTASQRITRQSRENELLLDDTRHKAARLEVVNQLARSINQSALDLEEVFQTALRGIDRIVWHTGASISLLDEQNGEVLDTVYSTGAAEDGKPADVDLVLAQKLLAEADTFLARDTRNTGTPELDAMAERGVLSLLLVSICLGDRKLGLVTLAGDRPGTFYSEDAAILKGVADQLAVAIENTRLIAETAETTALREGNRLKDEFMSMVSHELRTPLASIKGYSRTLLADYETWDEETRLEFLSIISDESDKLAELVENLLEMTRIEGGRLRVEPEPVLLHRFCNDVVNRISTHYPEMRFECDIPDGLPMVEADPRRVEQVLMNLLQNAARYSEAELIAVRGRYDGGRFVTLSVEDNGIGISPEHLPHLFDRFYRAANRREAGEGAGTGLGLAISRALIEAQGGRIWVASVPGKGTTFYFTLPVLSTPADMPPPTSGNGAGAITGPLGDEASPTDPVSARRAPGE